ncbi:MAG: aminotransferase class I/II-fold pyridoxal phosphate-dependent enzyme [Spirochaetaceae bacterium]
MALQESSTVQAHTRTDLFDKCDTDAGYFGGQRVEDDHYYTRPILPPKPGTVMDFQGEPKIMWSVNNYLGLADHPDIKKAATAAVEEFGTAAPMGSRMMTGNTEYHRALEGRLAEVAQKESAFLFNYGYLGVLGTIASLVGPDDVVVVDKLAHSCIVDGAFLASGTLRVFKHNNMESLETVLKKVNRERKGGVLIVTEGVYGMTGDVAKLREITELARRYDARLFIDDAHGWGVMGEQGRGSADYLGVQDDVDIYFGTFAKSFAAIGGFSAGEKRAIDWISYNARTQVFAKSLPMIYVRTLDTTLDLVTAADDRRERMWQNSAVLKEGISDLGYFVGPGESPICAVFAPLHDQDVFTVGKQLIRYFRDRGVFVTAVTYPVIPMGLVMFRMIPTADHTEEQIARTIEVFKSLRDEPDFDVTFGEEDVRTIRKVYGQA